MWRWFLIFHALLASYLFCISTFTWADPPEFDLDQFLNGATFEPEQKNRSARYVLKTVMEPAAAEAFFPSGISQMFGVAPSQVGFYGEKTQIYIPDGKIGPLQSFYLILYSKAPLDLSMSDSTNRHIRSEGELFDRSKRWEFEISGSALLIIRLHGSPAPGQNTYPKFYELLRYADHPEFRKRGIASALTRHLISFLKTLGAEALSVNNLGWPANAGDRSTGWPGKLYLESLLHPQWRAKLDAIEREQFLPEFHRRQEIHRTLHQTHFYLLKGGSVCSKLL